MHSLVLAVKPIDLYNVCIQSRISCHQVYRFVHAVLSLRHTLWQTSQASLGLGQFLFDYDRRQAAVCVRKARLVSQTD